MPPHQKFGPSARIQWRQSSNAYWVTGIWLHVRNVKVWDKMLFLHHWVRNSNFAIWSYWPYLFLRSPSYWKKFRCAGRSPNDPKWMQHQFPTISGLHAAKFSPGSVRSAFEAQKHTKICKTLFAQSKETNRLHASKKSIGRNLSCIKLMLQFTSHENDLFYMVFAIARCMYKYRAVAKCDWIFFDAHN